MPVKSSTALTPITPKTNQQEGADNNKLIVSWPKKPLRPRAAKDNNINRSGPKKPSARKKKTPKPKVSALVTQLRELKADNDSKTTEIAHLKRQLKILSEFKGFDVDGDGHVLLRSKLYEEEHNHVVSVSTMDQPNSDAPGHHGGSNRPDQKKNDVGGNSKPIIMNIDKARTKNPKATKGLFEARNTHVLATMDYSNTDAHNDDNVDKTENDGSSNNPNDIDNNSDIDNKRSNNPTAIISNINSTESNHFNLYDPLENPNLIGINSSANPREVIEGSNSNPDSIDNKSSNNPTDIISNINSTESNHFNLYDPLENPNLIGINSSANPKDVISTMNSIESNDSNDPMYVNLANSTSIGTFFTPSQPITNKYDDLDDKQLTEEFAKIASPKVSELLNEQALALDDLMHTPGWSSSSSSASSDGCISDDDNMGAAKPLIFAEGKYNNCSKTPMRRNTKGGRRKSTRHKRNDDEDDMNEEWNQLEAAQLNLKDELEAATHGFAQMLYANDDNDGGYADENYKSYSQDNGEEKGAYAGETPAVDEYSEEWRDSIHQYYTANNQFNDAAADKGGARTRRQLDDAFETLSPLLAKPNHSYTLADHATTLDVTRPASDRGLYIKPLLSRNELETLGVVSMPTWITRPSGEVSSRGRERYVRRILDCCVEYVEPPKSKNLRKLFSGWNPGPGEKTAEGENGERVSTGGAGDGSQRVMAYNPPTSPSHEDDSDLEDENDDNFVDIDGSMAYAQSAVRRPLEPLPVRTVTVRIRPDVLCGAVMDALTMSVERVGGEMTKRQGGHLRAVLPGRKMRVWLPGERERMLNGNNNQTDPTNNEDGFNMVESSPHDGCSSSNLCQNPNDDAASVTSSFTAMLYGSPSKPKGPRYDILPPYIVDAQLITKKAGKECQRLVLIRIYRMQDVARVRSSFGGLEDDDEAFDVIAPLDEPDDAGSSNSQTNKGRIVDPLVESKRSLKTLQEVSALVQRIKAVGGTGFSVDPPSQPMMNADSDAASVTSHTSTKSYLKSFGDAIVSPIRFLGGGGSSSAIGAVTPSKRLDFSSPYPTVIELMSSILLRKHIASPSVGTKSKSAMSAAKKRSNGVFPSLSKEDASYVQSSWLFLKDCVEELDKRSLAYSTLGINPIFQFPALPTLDVHFIAQIKAFCRENMIVSLVKTASELEIYAREFEVSCGNVDQLLRPTFEMYKLKPPQLPAPVPLTAYPLDFRAPEEIRPPFGPGVSAALDKIASKDSAINSSPKKKDNSQLPLSSFERSEKAIAAIVAAFQQQNDVEQGARLGRKNMQVMDRLAKMQAHKRNSIAKIQHSYGSNLLATKAADEFHLLRQKSSNVGSLTDVINAVPDTEVPLLVCNVLVGNSAGTCHVTHSHVLFNTQLLPILGGSKIHLFSIQDVELTINAPAKSVLSPLPASISFTTSVFGSRRKSNTREEVYNFIPSIGARRFAKFLEVLRDVALEDPDSLKFSDKGGLIYLAD